MTEPLGRGTAQNSVLHKLSLSVFLLMFAFAAMWVWFAVAANLDYDALAGSYGFQERGVSCTVRLAANHTFHQEVMLDGRTLVSDGLWSRYGDDGRVSFANLLAYPFQSDIASTNGIAPQRNLHKEYDGEFVKAFTLYPKLELQGYPVLRKKLFAD
jgi:hypothetical protein